MLKAKVKVHSERTVSDISPFLFGSFIEDMKDHMEGMLAYGITDMDFEEWDRVHRGVSFPWYPVTDGKNTHYELEPAAPQHTGHSQKLKLYSSENCSAGIAQKVFVDKEESYEIKLCLRASVEIRFIDIGLYDLTDRRPIDLKRIAIHNHDWQEYECILTYNGVKPAAELRISTNTREQQWLDVHSNGMLWLDHVSMLPKSRNGWVKRKVFQMAQELNSGIMRFGGNQMSCYHWKQFIGSFHSRPCLKSEAWGHWIAKQFGTDEYIELCRQLKVEPLICINAGSAGHQEAAEWVEYCNSPVNTELGALRAKNGHPEPYGVRYWEVGNELWGFRQVGHCSAEEYAERCVQYARAIKAVFPEARIIACGHYDNVWNEKVLRIAALTSITFRFTITMASI